MGLLRGGTRPLSIRCHARVYFARAVGPYASDGSEIVATREGPSETIFLMQQRWLGSPVYHRLVTNGFSMSGTTVTAMRYMRYFAYLPMFLHETPIHNALVVCYGLGVTARAVLDIPSIESVDIAEISGDVVRMSDRVYSASDHPLRDPRAHLTLEDGRFFLETSRRQYDLITGEPPPPRTPGAVNIYTREFFSLVRDHLADGGITTYWIPVARPDPGTDIDTAMRAFCDVFDDCTVWNATPFDLILVGSRHATGASDERLFLAPWQVVQLAERLREVGFERPEQIGATFLGDADYLRSLVANTPPLTDDFPQRLRPAPTRASLSDPRYAVDPSVARRYLNVVDPARALSAFNSSAFIRRRWPPGLASRTLPYFEIERIINSVLWDGGHALLQIEDLHRLLISTTLQTLPLWIVGSDDVKQRIATARGKVASGGVRARSAGAVEARFCICRDKPPPCGRTGASVALAARTAGVCPVPDGPTSRGAGRRQRHSAPECRREPFLDLDRTHIQCRPDVHPVLTAITWEFCGDYSGSGHCVTRMSRNRATYAVTRVSDQ